MLTYRIVPKKLYFKSPAGTSRGVYTVRTVWYVVLTDTKTGRAGIGECAPLPQLSCDDIPDYEDILHQCCSQATRSSEIDKAKMRHYPSMLFGLETAFLHLQRGSCRLFDTSFSNGEQCIPINGLIWMGSYDEMAKQIEEKLKQGFTCLKLKIGAIDFERELDLLRRIRAAFSPSEVTLRVDANGAFDVEDALHKLKALSVYELHSIEQPIRAGQHTVMRELCKQTPISIALDEELIGVCRYGEKASLLDTISPQYIILKPSLHGGMSGCEEWIELAKERGIGYWITSALESNVGLNAIAQWCATLCPKMPQGLGTGGLFVENMEMPIYLRGENLLYNKNAEEPDFSNWLS